VKRGDNLPPGARWRGNRIQVNVYRGYDAAKKRRMYATATVPTIPEAWAAWSKLKEQVDKQEYVPPTRVTVAEHLSEWLKTAKADIKPKTYQRYEQIVRLHLVPHIGSIQLSRLTPKHVDELLAKLKGKMSDRSRLHVYRVLHRALEVAVRWERVARNVCRVVDRPEADDPEMYVLSEAEIESLLSAAESDRHSSLYLTALYTGMRQGELFGLRWQDIDTAAGVAWVRQTLEEPGLNPVFGTPKNRKVRAVPLVPEVADALQSLRVEQEIERSHYAQDYRDYDLVFAQQDGGPISPSSFNRWSWQPVRRKAGLPDTVRFHDLRHTFVSRALAAGANPKAVSDIVGHHDPGFTLRRYAHTLHEDRKEAARLLAEHLNRTTSEDD
jgi:integrase